MKRLPSLADHQLVFAMEQAWLTRGPLRNYTRVKIGPNKENDIYRTEGKLYVKHLGIEQVAWFEDEESQKDRRGPFFHLHNLSLAEEKYKDNCLRAINDRLQGISDERRKTLDKIFGDIVISCDNQKFRGADFVGVHVYAPVLQIPLGKEGRLSDNLFVYAYNIIMRPCFRIALNQQQPPNDTWYEFIPRTNFST